MSTATDRPVKVIEAKRSWWRLDLADAWAHRELLWLLMWRNVTSRYAQMVLGIFWSVLEPLAMLLTLVVVFGLFIRVPTPGIPYPVFVFSALVPWLLFSKATMNAIGCLHDHMALVSKVYFPRILLPFAAVFRDLFDATILVVILVAIAWFYGYPPTWRLLMLPVLLISVTLLTVTIGLWLAGLLVKMRDIRPLMQIILQIGFYFTPILFPPSMVPASIMPFYQLNPMYWAIEGSRWIFLGQPLALNASFYASLFLSVVLFFLGLFVYSSQEKAAVDVQ
ncbi:ABC transporter permease [Afifella pfennigii]|uniref:ABC transporter permease n=1 Tax=Afifella pfennigii TaxID=209897 RepID=UPI00047944DF|nr:ABC transporter permease [Afifella pfennigii]